MLKYHGESREVETAIKQRQGQGVGMKLQTCFELFKIFYLDFLS